MLTPEERQQKFDKMQKLPAKLRRIADSFEVIVTYATTTTVSDTYLTIGEVFAESLEEHLSTLGDILAACHNKSTMVTPGDGCQGGQNPNNATAARPPAPGGSAGNCERVC